jgi:hypothetical protein
MLVVNKILAALPDIALPWFGVRGEIPHQTLEEHFCHQQFGCLENSGNWRKIPF